MTLIVIRFSTCVHVHHRRRHHHAEEAAALAAEVGHQNVCLAKPTQLLTMLGLLIEALLFGMFTSCMICKYCRVENAVMDSFWGSKTLVLTLIFWTARP